MHVNRRSVHAALLLIFVSVTPLSADPNDFYSWWSGLFSQFADPNAGLTVFPTLLIPMGGRYEGMGTAYAAMALDTGFIESNPSASALLSDTALSFSHHSWTADSNLEGVVYSVRFNELGIGFGGKFLYVPFVQYDAWGDPIASGYVSETVATANISYNFFQTYYFPGLAVGANVKIAYRDVPSVFALNQSAIAFMTDIGLQTSFDLAKFYPAREKNFAVGAALKNLGLSVLSGEQLPLMATLGVAYKPLRPWTISCDFNYPFSLDPVTAPAESWNVAVGTNVDITSFLSLQGGIHFDADNPRFSLGAIIELVGISFVVNYNLDLSKQLNPLDAFSALAQMDLGDFGRKAAQNQAESLFQAGMQEYASGNYEKAIEYWRQALEIDPASKYTLSREWIDTVQKTIDLQKQLPSSKIGS
jgi:hypothetical protein